MHALSENIRISVLYEYKLGRTAFRACRNLNKAYGQGAISIISVKRWFARFRQGDEDVDMNVMIKSSITDVGRLTTSLRRNPAITTRELAREFGVDRTTITRYSKRLRNDGELPVSGVECIHEVASDESSSRSDSGDFQEVRQAS
ncbi:hypothetical protein COOONC_13559 [Cooperia oncophora]